MTSRRGTITDVARSGEYVLCCYGMTGAGWAVFKDKQGSEPPYVCVVNGKFDAVFERWKECLKQS